MSRGFPSMTALLGLLAVAGYQHRDKLAELLSGSGQGTAGRDDPAGRPGGVGTSAHQSGGLGGLLGSLGGMLGGASGGNVLNGGLGELVERFRQNGHGETADSWVAHGPNRELPPDQLERAIGEDTLADLSRQTGLSRQELLARLSRELPNAVDQYTPDGRLPT
ncbi:YidB family protein [Geminicoccus roseus]|uniref:YidB family protein n=1 Tax=Geminicoccus roseus TaxID=404900 RepID=UPI000484070B|nr:YidB family protein [Geminicoccus roseus]